MQRDPHQCQSGEAHQEDGLTALAAGSRQGEEEEDGQGGEVIAETLGELGQKALPPRWSTIPA